jgi:hypothetical protein
MSEWQAIETASTNGKSILIYDHYKPGIDGYGWVVGRYDQEHGWVMHQRNGIIINLVNPTHWMPLPDPPKVVETTKEVL